MLRENDSIIILGAKIQKEEFFRFFVNTKKTDYKGNINAEQFYRTYLEDQIIITGIEGFKIVASGGAEILNARGKFKDGIDKVVEIAKAASINQIKSIEMVDDFLNSKDDV